MTLLRITKHMLLRHMIGTYCARFLIIENVHRSGSTQFEPDIIPGHVPVYIRQLLM